MNILSITSTKTMSYDADASARAFAIIEKLINFTNTVLKAARKIWSSVSNVPALRTTHAWGGHD